MPAFLTLDSVSAATPDGEPLFSDLSLSLGRERVGLVGRNGSGKSTLLRMLAGERAPLSGTVHCEGTLSLLVQDFPEELSIAEALGIAEPLARLARIVAGEGSESDFAQADWTLEGRAEEALARFGLGPEVLGEGAVERRMASLSGGERMRVGLARLVIEQPDVLLLDEPTNNLDAAGRSAVTDLVRDWPGGLLLASHDRALLEHMDRIVELSPVGTHIVGGGWTEFAAQRRAERERAAQDLERSEAEAERVKRAGQRRRELADRRDKAGRAFAASGSAPKILLGGMAERAENSRGQAGRLAARQADEAEARMRAARERVEVVTPLAMELPPANVPAGTVWLAVEDAVLTYGERRLGPWNLTIRGPERVAIAGPNGAGKSSLLRLAAGLAEPDAGSVRRVEDRIVLLDQHVGLLDPQMSVLDNFRRLNPSLDREAAHAACARFAFRNRDALQAVGTLSGGERLRAGLACTLAGERPPWLLLLDEPTNHLDLAAAEALEVALSAYNGGMLVVSHDRAFLQAIGTTQFVDLGHQRTGGGLQGYGFRS